MKRYFLKFLSSFLGKAGISVQRGVDPIHLLVFISLFFPQWNPEALIRIGGDDGGYLVPGDIDSYEILISPGVGETTLFDEYFLLQNKKVISIDPGEYEFHNPLVQFHKKWLRGYSSESDEAISLSEILNQIDLKASVCLQMDIEGGEYEVIASLSPTELNRFGIIVVELHLLGELLTKDGFQLISQPLRKLLKTHFVAHLHVNNSGHIHGYKGIHVPETMEVTLLSRSRYKPELCHFKSPHNLDVRCISDLPEKLVPGIWFKQKA
jgi:hypothetical protein